MPHEKINPEATHTCTLQTVFLLLGVERRKIKHIWKKVRDLKKPGKDVIIMRCHMLYYHSEFLHCEAESV